MDHIKFNVTNPLLLNNRNNKYVRIYYTEKSIQKLQSFNNRAQSRQPIALAVGIDGSRYEKKGYVAASCSTLDIYATAQTAEHCSDKHETAALELGLILTHYLLLPRIPEHATVQLFTDQLHFPQKWSGEQKCPDDARNKSMRDILRNYHDPRILVAYTPSHQGSEHKDHKIADSLIHAMRDKTPLKKDPAKKIEHQTNAEFQRQLSIATKHEQKIMLAIQAFPVGSNIKAEIKGFPPNSIISRPTEIKPTMNLKVVTHKKTKSGNQTTHKSSTVLGNIHRLISTPPKR